MWGDSSSAMISAPRWRASRSRCDSAASSRSSSSRLTRRRRARPAARGLAPRSSRVGRMLCRACSRGAGSSTGSGLGAGVDRRRGSAGGGRTRRRGRGVPRVDHGLDLEVRAEHDHQGLPQHVLAAAAAEAVPGARRWPWPAAGCRPRSSATWAFWLSRIQVNRRLPLTSSSTSGQSRRTSVTVSSAPGAGVAGSGSEPSLVSSVSPPAGPRCRPGRSGPGRATPRARLRRARARGWLGARPEPVEPGGLGPSTGSAAAWLPGCSRARWAVGPAPERSDPRRSSPAAARAGRGGRGCPRSSTSAPGSSTRAHISSRCSRGAVVPRMSVSPSAITSAARVSSPAPSAAAWEDSRSAWSAATSTSPDGERVGHGGDDHQVPQPAEQVLGEPARVLADLDHLVHAGEHPTGVARRRRRRRTRPAASRGCSRAGPSPAGRPTPCSSAPPSSWSSTDSESRTEPGPGADHQRQHRRPRPRSPRRHTACPGSRSAPAAAPAGTGSGGSATGWCRSPCPARWWRR